MAQTQFTDSLFPGNPVLTTVTLYLNYLLFRYFQHAFHIYEFSIWRKSTEEIQAMLYLLDRMLSIYSRCILRSMVRKAAAIFFHDSQI